MGNFNQRGNNRFSRRPGPMHHAVCADCGRRCEVPFRPTGDKPVYCNECFAKKGGGRGGDDRGPRRDFGGRAPARPSFEGNRGCDDIKKQLESLNSKIDQLIKAIETNSKEKKPAKKAPAKKKAKK